MRFKDVFTLTKFCKHFVETFKERKRHASPDNKQAFRQCPCSFYSNVGRQHFGWRSSPRGKTEWDDHGGVPLENSLALSDIEFKMDCRFSSAVLFRICRILAAELAHEREGHRPSCGSLGGALHSPVWVSRATVLDTQTVTRPPFREDLNCFLSASDGQ